MVTPHSMIREQAIKDISQNQDADDQLKAMINSPFHLIVDSGFSSTYGVPFFSGIPMKQSSLRIDVGGKLLTNLLIETISHKDFNLQGEFGLVNGMKEKTCFIAKSYEEFIQYMKSLERPTYGWNVIQLLLVMEFFKTVFQVLR